MSPRFAPLMALAVAAGLSCGASIRAQTVDPVESAFWRSVETSDRPEEYQAYLDVYPNGRFAFLARSHMGAMARVPLGQPAPRAPVRLDPAPGTPVAGVMLRPTRTSLRLVDGVTLDLDAQALRDSSNLRVIVVPAGSPDAVADAFVLDSSPVRATRQRLTIPAGPPGEDEVRLYHIPRFGSTFQVAARAPVTIGPGVPGATLSRDLAREAARLGPLRFEANHRDRPLMVQAAFLRAKPRTEWNVGWFDGALREVPGDRFVVISVGQPNVVPDAYGTTGEAVCVLSADDRQALDRVAALNLGDPVVVRGIPTSWSSAATADPVVLRDCSMAE